VLFDAIALGLAVLFIALGAFRGTLAGFLRVATLTGAYVSGVLAATKLCKVAALLAGSSRLTAAVVLGTGAFLAVYLVGSIISALLIRAERERREDEPRGPYDRFGGACFGALQAGLALLLLAVLGSVLDAAYRAGLPQGMDQSGSYLIGSTRQVVATGIGAALGDGPGAKLAVKLVADPRFAKLQEDSLFWQLLADGDLDTALARTSFFQLMHDEDTRARMADLGLVPEAARSDPQAFRASLRVSLAGAAPRIRAIRDDPALAELAADPEIQSAVESGDSVALLAHPQMRALIDRVLRDYERSAPAAD
jgi:Colicin V production protein